MCSERLFNASLPIRFFSSASIFLADMYGASSLVLFALSNAFLGSSTANFLGHQRYELAASTNQVAIHSYSDDECRKPSGTIIKPLHLLGGKGAYCAPVRKSDDPILSTSYTNQAA